MNLEWLCLLVPLAVAVFAFRSAPRHRARGAALTFAFSVVALLAARSLIVLGLGEDWEYSVEIAETARYERPTMSMGTQPVPGSNPVRLRLRASYDPARWTLIGREGEQLFIDEAKFTELQTRWGPAVATASGEEIHWPGLPKSAVFITTVRGYYNPFQATRRGVGFPSIGAKEVAEYGLHRYPEIEESGTVDMVLGAGGKRREEGEFMLKRLNATLGRERNFQAWVLLFPGQSPDAGALQEALWRGGNRFEFVVCLGVDRQDRITWCRSFSWTPNQKLLSGLSLPGRQLDLVDVVTQIEGLLKSSWTPPDTNRHRFFEIMLPLGALIVEAVVAAIVGLLACAAANSLCESAEQATS